MISLNSLNGITCFFSDTYYLFVLIFRTNSYDLIFNCLILEYYQELDRIRTSNGLLTKSCLDYEYSRLKY